MHYKRNDKYKIYSKCDKDNLKGATKYENTELTLPLHLHLTDDDITKIIKIINND
jgi:dTDP-4-amino-4,6-dideoxygalactose transaminase